MMYHQECAAERDGYYDVRLIKGVPRELKRKLETGEASSIIPVSLFPKLAHKYRLGTDVLMSSFNTYYIQLRHPLKTKINGYLSMLTDSGINGQIRQKYKYLPVHKLFFTTLLVLCM